MTDTRLGIDPIQNKVCPLWGLIQTCMQECLQIEGGKRLCAQGHRDSFPNHIDAASVRCALIFISRFWSRHVIHHLKLAMSTNMCELLSYQPITGLTSSGGWGISDYTHSTATHALLLISHNFFISPNFRSFWRVVRRWMQSGSYLWPLGIINANCLLSVTAWMHYGKIVAVPVLFISPFVLYNVLLSLDVATDPTV